MAEAGQGYFDSKGQYFKTANEATISDLSALLGRVGDGESLALGIATNLLEKRSDIERIFAEHDAMGCLDAFVNVSDPRITITHLVGT